MAINRLPLLLLLLLSCIYHTASFRHIPPKKDACSPSGYLQGIDAVCNQEHGAECCKARERYPQHRCSPPIISGGTKATLALNSFEAGGDGGGPSACTNTFHSNTELIAALSTGWYDKGSRCGRKITITASNGKSVRATVVDECDSMYGCDSNHGFQPPCRTDIVDASFAVWNALGIGTDAGNAEVKWSDTA